MKFKDYLVSDLIDENTFFKRFLCLKDNKEFVNNPTKIIIIKIFFI